MTWSSPHTERSVGSKKQTSTPLNLVPRPSCKQLIDFGLSKHLESVATLGVGTPDYMPPEMLRSAKRPTPSFQHLPHQAGPTFAPPTPPTPAAVAGPAGPLGAPSGPPTYHQQQQQAPPYDAKAVDAWAMGVVLYLLLTGTYPFEVRGGGWWASHARHMPCGLGCASRRQLQTRQQEVHGAPTREAQWHPEAAQRHAALVLIGPSYLSTGLAVAVYATSHI
jgi:hypothetical protein